MSDNIELKTFPANKTDALTMLYLSQNGCVGLSPEELVVKYLEVRERIAIQLGKPRK